MSKSICEVKTTCKLIDGFMECAKSKTFWIDVLGGFIYGH